MIKLQKKNLAEEKRGLEAHMRSSLQPLVAAKAAASEGSNDAPSPIAHFLSNLDVHEKQN